MYIDVTYVTINGAAGRERLKDWSSLILWMETRRTCNDAVLIVKLQAFIKP